MSLPSVHRVAEIGRAIASVQQPNGSIPWCTGRHTDPWNHIEAAMALDVAGLLRESERAYGWLMAEQRYDGSWNAGYLDGGICDPGFDTNYCAYSAVGTWHHYLVTGDEGFLVKMWPRVEKAIGFVLELQTTDGAIIWARAPDGVPEPFALLASSACIWFSLRCAITIAEHMGDPRPDWELALASLRRAVTHGSEHFADKDEFSMDWYYPVLSGAIEGPAARSRILERWNEFIVEGLGVRCVSDRPWITSAESAELATALHRIGMTEEAREIFKWIQWLRADDGAYWTGGTFPGRVIWPREKTTWSGAAVLIASEVLGGTGCTADLFTGHTLYEPIDVDDVLEEALKDP